MKYVKHFFLILLVVFLIPACAGYKGGMEEQTGGGTASDEGEYTDFAAKEMARAPARSEPIELQRPLQTPISVPPASPTGPFTPVQFTPGGYFDATAITYSPELKQVIIVGHKDNHHEGYQGGNLYLMGLRRDTLVKVWDRVWEPRDTDHFTGPYVKGVAVDPFGFVYVVGSSSEDMVDDGYDLHKEGTIGRFNYERNMFVIRYNPSFRNSDGTIGKEMFVLQVPASDGPYWKSSDASAVTVDKDGYAYVAGTTNGSMRGNPYNPRTSGVYSGADVFIMKLKPFKPYVMWTHQFGSSYDESANSVTVDKDGNIYVAVTRTIKSSGDKKDVYIYRIDPRNGSEALIANLETPDVCSQDAKGMTADDDGNIYMTGTTNSDLAGGGACEGRDLSNIDMYVAKFSPEGEKIWVKQYGARSRDGMTPAIDEGTSVAVDGSGNVYVVGYTTGQINDLYTAMGAKDAFIRKYDPAGNVVKTERIGTAGLDEAAGVIVDDRNDVYVTGKVGGYLVPPPEGSTAEVNDSLPNIFAVKYGPDGALK